MSIYKDAREHIEKRRREAFELGLNVGLVAGMASGALVTYILLTRVFG